MNGGYSDLYLRDLVTHTTRLLSMNTNGLATGSSDGDMSADGRWIAFEAFGPGLSPEVSDWHSYIYLRDMLSGTTRLVSTNFGGVSSYSPRISADGRFIAFISYPFYGEQTDIFLHDTETGNTTLVTRSCSGQARATNPRLSGDGRFVFFESSNIDFGDGEYLPQDNNIFRWDRLREQTTLISVNKARTGGARGWESIGALSHDGNLLAFTSDSPDLAFGDNNGSYDVFVWQAGILPRLSISRANGIVTVSWPSDSPPAVLEQRTPESSWTPVTGPIQQEGDRYSYEVAIGGASTRFFQLRLL